MSLISKALKKIQESRQEQPKNTANNIVYLTDAPQSWPRTALMALLIICTLASVFMSMTALRQTIKNTASKQIQISALEKTIKAQQNRIDDFIAIVNKNQNNTDAQIRNVKNQTGNLVKTDNDHYSNLRDAILDDKEEIGLLNMYAKNLNQKIDKIAAAASQAKDLTVPAAGN